MSLYVVQKLLFIVVLCISELNILSTYKFDVGNFLKRRSSKEISWKWVDAVSIVFIHFFCTVVCFLYYIFQFVWTFVNITSDASLVRRWFCNERWKSTPILHNASFYLVSVSCNLFMALFSKCSSSKDTSLPF